MARRHRAGIVDLSVGTPVDPTPDVVQAALTAAADAPGYPTAWGSVALREACARWLRRRLEADVAPTAVVPGIGSKELVASIPRLLGLAPGSRIAIPKVAYPTYAVGAILAGCEPVPVEDPQEVDDAALVWLNSPSNPTGAVLSAQRQAQIVRWARERGAIVVADECYIELGWTERPTSLLHPSVCADSHDGLLTVHSLSKRSNLAGYRFGFVAGDGGLVADLLAVRKHAGLMVPTPVQQAAIAALDDDEHVRLQRERYRRRRGVLRTALETAGFRIDDSHAGLYLWVTRDEPCWQTVAWFADRGVLVAPGDFYGPAGAHHVRIALTGVDDAVDQVPGRLATS